MFSLWAFEGNEVRLVKNSGHSVLGHLLLFGLLQGTGCQAQWGPALHGLDGARCWLLVPKCPAGLYRDSRFTVACKDCAYPGWDPPLCWAWGVQCVKGSGG